MIKRAGLSLGFTLIEMAIVLVVIGLILSGGIVAVTPIIENTKITETNGKLDRVEQALVLYVIRYGCLPCPALATDNALTVATAGQSRAGGAVYVPPASCNAAVCDNAQGVVPWFNLGISENDASDAFGTRFSYAITSAAAAPGNLQATDGMERVGSTTYPVGALQVQNNGNTPLTTTAAYVLISHGPNRSNGFRAQIGGTALTAANTSAFEGDNSDGNPAYRQDEYNGNSAGGSFFDDIVRWRTAPFIVQLCGANACGNPA